MRQYLSRRDFIGTTTGGLALILAGWRSNAASSSGTAQTAQVPRSISISTEVRGVGETPGATPLSRSRVSLLVPTL